MSARLTITLSRTPVWLLFLACLFAIPAHADRYDGAGDRGFHWRDILRDAARDEIRQYRVPDGRSGETREYRGDEPRDRYDGWREQRAARWAERERRAAMKQQQRQEADARAQQEREAERARREEEQRRQEAAERERQLLLEQQQREEAAAREREELARQRLIAQQQEEQRAAEQARLEREQQQREQAAQQARLEQERQRLIEQQQEEQRVAEQARLERERQQQAERAYRQEQERRELVKLCRYWAERLVWLGLAAGVLALSVPAYRYWLEGRASTEGFGAVVGGKTLLSLLCLAGFVWMSIFPAAWAEEDLPALALAALGLPGAFFLPGLLLLVLEYLHYLFVPHPVERSVRRILRTQNLRLEDFEDITRRLYDCEHNGLLPAWRFRNLRQRIEEMQNLVEREDRLLGGLGEHVKKRAQARR